MEPPGHVDSHLVSVQEEETEFSSLNVGAVPKMVLWRLITLTIDFCGIFFAYSLQGVVIVPLFLSFGLSQSETSLVMLISPIAVICTFPIIGVLSDRCTLALGRRRPFILLGVILQIIGLTLLASAADVGYWLGDPLPPSYSNGDTTTPVQIYAIIQALIGYSFMDFAAGVMQLPSRALLMDLTPTSQQTFGAALFAFWMSAGNAMGYLCGSVDWSEQFSWVNTLLSSDACPPGSCVNYRLLFIYACLLDIITISITMITSKEKRLESSDTKISLRFVIGKFCGIFKEMWQYVRHRMDAETGKILLVYFVSWLSWPLWTFYISDWVGTVVYDGDPSQPEGSVGRDNYNDGVEMASFALFLYSVVAFLYSILLPYIIRLKWFGYRSVWAGGMFFHGFIYFALIVIRNKIATMILISLAGVNLATMHVVPWALVGFVTLKEDGGVAFALVNVCNAIPSLFLNGIINPSLSYIFSSLIPAMCFGGITMIIAGLLVFFVQPPHVKNK